MAVGRPPRPSGRGRRRRGSGDERDELVALARRLVEVGVAARDRVRPGPGWWLGVGERDGSVVRSEGGDDIFGIDERAERTLLDGLGRIGTDFPGVVVMEGQRRPLVVGRPGGPWRYLVDPLDGTRPLLADKRSGWVLIGAGRGARTLEDLELSVVVECRPAGRRWAWWRGPPGTDGSSRSTTTWWGVGYPDRRRCGPGYRPRSSPASSPWSASLPATGR